MTVHPVFPAAPSDRPRRPSELSRVLTELEAAVRRSRDSEVWLVEVERAVCRLRDVLQHHVAVQEGPDSFHADVVRQQPALAPRVAALQRDHAHLAQQVAELLSVTRTPADAGTVAQTQAQARDLLHAFARHRRHGTDLVWDALAFELGGEQ